MALRVGALAHSRKNWVTARAASRRVLARTGVSRTQSGNPVQYTSPLFAFVKIALFVDRCIAPASRIFCGAASGEMFEAMNRAIAANGIKPVIDKVFGFDEVQAAYKHMASGAHFGKIVIRVA